MFEKRDWIPKTVILGVKTVITFSAGPYYIHDCIEANVLNIKENTEKGFFFTKYSDSESEFPVFYFTIIRSGSGE